MWDTASGRLLHQIDITEITSAVFGADSRTLVLGGDDGVTRLWDLSKETYTGLASSDTQWVVYTPNGHFDGSPRAGELLAIAQGRRAFGVDQFALVNNRPDLIIDQLGFGKSDVIRHYAALHERRVRRFQARLQTGGFTEETQPSPSFDLDLPSARFLSSRQTDGYVDLSISFSDDRHPLAFYNVYVNDVPVFSGFGAPLERNQTAERDIRVTLTQGLNKIEGGVFNAVGSEALRALTLATYNPEVASRGSLYYIGFGTSKYAVRDLNLDYAHKDALDLARMFGLAQGYRDVHTLTFTDQEVTLDNIRRAKALLRTAQVEDTVVLFISGHGKHEDTAEATYYYLTHDADPGHLAETAADFEMIEATLSGIPPRQKLFLMDTCESGEIDDVRFRLTLESAKGRGLKARSAPRDISAASAAPRRRRREWLHNRERYIYNDITRRTGAIVFSSSRGGEFSYESSTIENGYFTEAIIRALTADEAGAPVEAVSGRFISTKKLQSDVISRVTDWTGGLQHPTVDRENLYIRFGFEAISVPGGDVSALRTPKNALIPQGADAHPAAASKSPLRTL